MQFVRFAMLLGLASTACFAETWSGPLVDSKCYGAEQRNVNPTDTQTAVDVDRGYEIQYCSPTRKTKRFAIVGPEGERLKLDDAGNTKAAHLVRSAKKRTPFAVTVTGARAGNRVQVDSITAQR